MMSRELDRRVAEALGYCVEEIEISAQTGRTRWCLVDPHGKFLHPVDPYVETKDEVWEELTPQFSTDTDLALPLLPEWTEVRSVMLRQTSDGWLASIRDLTQTQAGTASEELGDTLAEAICRVWLRWQRGG
jgi:hypothetical protein